MRYALVKGNVAENVILWDGQGDYEAPEGYDMVGVSDQVSAGWQWDGHTWQAPPSPEIPVPEEDPAVRLAKEQAAADLVALGISPANARTIVGIPSEEGKEEA